MHGSMWLRILGRSHTESAEQSNQTFSISYRVYIQHSRLFQKMFDNYMPYTIIIRIIIVSRVQHFFS